MVEFYYNNVDTLKRKKEKSETFPKFIFKTDKTQSNDLLKHTLTAAILLIFTSIMNYELICIIH